MGSLLKARAVTFDCDDVVITGVGVNDKSSDDFYEITTSKAESFVTLDEDDAEFIQMVLQTLLLALH